MKKIIKLSLLILPFLASTVFAGDDAKDIVKKLKNRYEDFKTLKVNFSQTMVWALAGEESSVEGILYATGDNKYRVETDLQTIVTDGKTVWTYSKDKKQVMISAVGNSRDNQTPREMLLKYTREYSPQLNGEVVFNNVRCYDITFSPKEADDFIVSTRVFVDRDNWFALKIEQEDINENITRYELGDYELDKAFKGDLFKFPIPKDAEVLDMR